MHIISTNPTVHVLESILNDNVTQLAYLFTQMKIHGVVREKLHNDIKEIVKHLEKAIELELEDKASPHHDDAS